MKIGILITGHPPEELSENGLYDAYFERLLGKEHFTYQTWSVVDGEMPNKPDDAEGWLITGSRHGVYEPHPWIPPLEQFVRACYGARIPMIGVCFGHQVIAQAMGGKVEKFKEGWSVGAVDYTLNGETTRINAWHQDQVIEKPDTATVIGHTDFCAYAALVYDDVMWTIQPHPEYDHDFMNGLIKHRGKGLVPDVQLDEARARSQIPLDSTRIVQEMTTFFKKERS